MKMSFVTAILATGLSIVTYAGCADDGSVEPGTEVGTIVIDTSPDDIDAPWTLTGPDSYIRKGSGDRTLTGRAAGDYSITWGSVPGWTRPIDETKTLVVDGRTTFSGTYAEDAIGPYVLIPSGSFMMGSPEDEYNRQSDETLHAVDISEPFHMLATEVTNAQYAELAQWAYDNGYCSSTEYWLTDALDGSTRGLLDYGSDGILDIMFSEGMLIVKPGTEDQPVDQVTWFGAAAFCDWLSLRDDLPRAYDHDTWECNGIDPYGAQGYRLPTEAEWEYACRAGTQTPFNTGECLDAGTEANYDGLWPYIDCPAGPHAMWKVAVGSYPPNAFGLYDMHGNLRELCNDWYGSYSGDATDPVGPSTGTSRVFRGGHFDKSAWDCRSARRYPAPPEYSVYSFRPVKSAE